MKVGVIGLGRMGASIAQKLAEGGHEVIGWNRTPEEISGLITAETVESLASQLDSPKVFWIMVPAAAVEEVLVEVKKFVSAGDVIIDGGNSNYKETQKRFDEFESLGVHFLGIGVSGGILARENGFPLMAGGSEEGYRLISPILETLSKPNGGYDYFGRGGAGHFVKMVHNGVEYGMMQSIAEGFAVLDKSDYSFDLAKIANVWKRGTIISGLLMDLASKQLDKEPNLDSFSGIVSRSGEGDWTIEAAAEESLDIPAIEAAVYYRKDTEVDENLQKSFTAKVLNALRAAFGGHQVKKG